MKRLLILLILVGIVGGFWYMNQKESNAPKIDIADTGTNSVGKPDPSNAIFRFDSGVDTAYDLVFKNGVAKRTVKEGSVSTTFETTITDYRAEGDLNGDKQNDIALIMYESSGLNASPVYIAAYVSGPIRYKGTNVIYVGDRIEPQKITISGGLITFTYLDRNPDEPLAADPTVPTTKTYIFQNGLLVER